MSPRTGLAAAFLFLACSHDSTTPPETTSPCVAGEVAGADGSCTPAGLPAGLACPPGTWVPYGQSDGACVPAGVPPDGCGVGFVHDGDRGCDPILPVAPCPSPSMAVMGEQSCRDVAPCAAGLWGDIPTDTSTEHVDPSYPGMDSDGSSAKPWITIQQAVNAAAPGAIVAVAQGSYAEDVIVLGKAARIWGRCPGLVEIVGTGGSSAAVAFVSGAHSSELRDIAIRGLAHGVMVSGATDVSLDRVWVHDTGGRGIVVQDNPGVTSATLERSLVERTVAVGVFAAGADLTISSTNIRDIDSGASGGFGFGVDVEHAADTMRPASLSLGDSLIERCRDSGVIVVGAAATIERSAVRETRADALGRYGNGVYAIPESSTGTVSSIVIDRSVMAANPNCGVAGEDVEIMIDRTVIEGSVATLAEQQGRGIVFQPFLPGSSTSSATVRGSLVERSGEIGAFFNRSLVLLEGVAIRDNIGALDGTAGRGVELQLSQATVRGALIERARDAGMYMEGSSVTIETSRIAHTLADAGDRGAGIGAEVLPTSDEATTLSLFASELEGNHGASLVVIGARAEVEHCRIAGTASDTQQRARGVHVQHEEERGIPGHLVLLGVLVEGNAEFGVAVFSATAELLGTVVRDTTARRDALYGDGVALLGGYNPAAATVADSKVERSARAGISAFGADVVLLRSLLACHAFDLSGDAANGRDFHFEDGGGNHCGCPDPTGGCQVISSGLEPPSMP